MPLLTVIAGGANTGKSLLAEALVEKKGYALVARDAIRSALVSPVDEWALTLLMVEMARSLLRSGLDVLTVSWNLEAADREAWVRVARDTRADLRWVQVEVVGL